MKKIFISIFFILVILTMTACSANSLEGACAEADKMVSSWDSQKTAGCSYTYEYDAEDNLYIVAAKAGSEYYGDDSRLYDATTQVIAQTVRDELYPKLEKTLSKYDVDIAIGIYDYNNEMYCCIYNGNIEYGND